MKNIRKSNGARPSTQRQNDMQRHRGAALIVTLLMMTVLLMLGISAVQFAWQGEKSGRGDRDRQVAFHSAEAALIDAQRDIDASRRRSLFEQEVSQAFCEDCDNRGNELHLGLCKTSDPMALPVWARVDFLDGDGDRNRTVPYGFFTGQQFPVGVGLIPSRPPRYIIERFSRTDEEGNTATAFYRITALGFGMRDTTQVMLQAYYRPNHAGDALSTGPKGRFGWREIVNWREVRSAHNNG